MHDGLWSKAQLTVGSKCIVVYATTMGVSQCLLLEARSARRSVRASPNLRLDRALSGAVRSPCVGNVFSNHYHASTKTPSQGDALVFSKHVPCNVFQLCCLGQLQPCDKAQAKMQHTASKLWQGRAFCGLPCNGLPTDVRSACHVHAVYMTAEGAPAGRHAGGEAERSGGDGPAAAGAGGPPPGGGSGPGGPLACRRRRQQAAGGSARPDGSPGG
jgi:hypothetical protein